MRKRDLSPTLRLPERKTMTVAPFFGLEVFGPCEIKAMSIALDEVCGKLGLTDDKHEERAVLAKRIIALARNGERDPAVPPRRRAARACVSAWRGMSHSDRALPQ